MRGWRGAWFPSPDKGHQHIKVWKGKGVPKGSPTSHTTWCIHTDTCREKGDGGLAAVPLATDPAGTPAPSGNGSITRCGASAASPRIHSPSLGQGNGAAQTEAGGRSLEVNGSVQGRRPEELQGAHLCCSSPPLPPSFAGVSEVEGTVDGCCSTALPKGYAEDEASSCQPPLQKQVEKEGPLC